MQENERTAKKIEYRHKRGPPPLPLVASRLHLSVSISTWCKSEGRTHTHAQAWVSNPSVGAPRRSSPPVRGGIDLLLLRKRRLKRTTHATAYCKSRVRVERGSKGVLRGEPLQLLNLSKAAGRPKEESSVSRRPPFFLFAAVVSQSFVSLNSLFPPTPGLLLCL